MEASGAVVLGAHWHSSQGQSSGEELPLTSGRSSDSWKEKKSEQLGPTSDSSVLG